MKNPLAEIGYQATLLALDAGLVVAWIGSSELTGEAFDCIALGLRRSDQNCCFCESTRAEWDAVSTNVDVGSDIHWPDPASIVHRSLVS